MSVNHSLRILAALSLWAAMALSQAAPARTVSAMISAESSTPALQQCDSICTLMAYPVPGVGSSLFASYCKGTERTDCGVDKMQFKINLVGASTGQALSFECTCDLPPPGPLPSSLPSSQSPTASVGSSSESPTTLPAFKTADTTTGITSTEFSSVSPSGSPSVSPSKNSLSSTSIATATAFATSTNTTKTTPTPTTTGRPTEPAKSTAALLKAEGKASKGTIVGIVVGVLCILACSGVGVLAIYRRRQKKKIDQGYIDSFRACSEIQRVV